MTAPPVPLTSGSVWRARAVIVNHDTGTETEVGVISATVTVDRKSDARRVVDAELTPDVDPNLLTAPHRLKLYAGYRVSGSDYWAPLAHVRMGRRGRAPLGPWQVRQARSFETLVAAARFREPRRIEVGVPFTSAIRDLILEAVPWGEVRVDTTAATVGVAATVTYEQERWQAVAGREQSLATVLGLDVGCDGDGTFVIRDLPSGAPTWDVSEGGLLVDYSEEISSDDVRNVWVAYNDHPDTIPARGIAEDTDPYSPTRVSRWGQAVGYYSSPLLVTGDMCFHAAYTRLQMTRGLTVSLDMSSVPNPWADITDIVSSTRAGMSYQHQIDRLTHSLKPDVALTMTAAARTVNIGG